MHIDSEQTEALAYRGRRDARKRLAVEFRESGLTPKEAHRKALHLIPEPVEPPETEITDLVEAAEWVMEALGREARYVKRGDAPTSGTWALYEWAKENRNKFFESVWPKALAMKQKRQATGNEDLQRRERRSLQQLAEELRGYWDELKHTSLDEFGLPE